MDVIVKLFGGQLDGAILEGHDITRLPPILYFSADKPVWIKKECYSVLMYERSSITGCCHTYRFMSYAKEREMINDKF